MEGSPAAVDGNQLASLVTQSALVFRGRVERMQAAGLDVIRDTSSTALVGVGRVFRAPAGTALPLDGQVTVLLRDAASVSEGAQLVFFATSWMYGESIAVREVAHLPADPKQDEAFARAVSRAEQEVRDAELVRRVAAADVVALAEVTALDANVESHPPAGAERVIGPGRVDRAWQSVDVTVQSLLRGTARMKRITVLVPIEDDPPWRTVPALRKGARVILFLRRVSDSGGEGAWLVADRDDLRPVKDRARVERAIEEAGR